MIIRYVQRLPHAIRGIFYALGNDSGFRHQFYLATVVSVGILYFFNPLTFEEFLFLATATMFILITELQNSALESTLDQLHPERHDKIKHSKDMAAGAVLMAGLFALLVIVVLIANRFLV